MNGFRSPAERDASDMPDSFYSFSQIALDE
jgi:hypothetical protein